VNTLPEFEVFKIQASFGKPISFLIYNESRECLSQTADVSLLDLFGDLSRPTTPRKVYHMCYMDKEGKLQIFEKVKDQDW
jgi:hypothetical protein